MSSSRIIKSEHLQPDSGVSEFSFRPIGQAAAPSAAEAHGSGFVPLGFFDPSQLPGQPDTAAEAAEEQPAGSFISDEALDQQLRDSFNSGLQEGKNLAERGLVNVFHALRTASEQIRSLRERVLRESEDELVNLVIMVARKVINRELAQDSGILALLVQTALADLSKREEITVRLNPQDHAVLHDKHGTALQQELQFERLQIKADATIAPGGCEIDTELGTIDVSIDAQLEEVYRHLLEQRNAALAEEQV